jgi:hypothetical protein
MCMEPVTVRAAPWNWRCMNELAWLTALLFGYSVAIRRVKINGGCTVVLYDFAISTS